MNSNDVEIIHNGSAVAFCYWSVAVVFPDDPDYSNFTSTCSGTSLLNGPIPTDAPSNAGGYYVNYPLYTKCPSLKTAILNRFARATAMGCDGAVIVSVPDIVYRASRIRVHS